MSSYDQFIQFLGSHGQSNYDDQALQIAQSLSHLGAPFSLLLDTNFNATNDNKWERERLKRIQNNPDFLREYVNDYLALEHLQQNEASHDSLVITCAQALLHEAYYSLLDQKSSRNFGLNKNFVKGVALEAIASEELRCPFCHNKLQSEHLTHRGDFVCLDCANNFDVDLKTAKSDALDHCKMFRKKLPKAILTPFAAYKEEFNHGKDFHLIYLDCRNNTTQIASQDLPNILLSDIGNRAKNLVLNMFGKKLIFLRNRMH